MDSQLEKEGFQTQFAFEGRNYIANIKYPYPLSEKEKALYKVEDGEFLVHLTDDFGSRAFKVYFTHEFEWETDSPTLLIEKELVQIIGGLIDSKLA